MACTMEWVRDALKLVNQEVRFFFYHCHWTTGAPCGSFKEKQLRPVPGCPEQSSGPSPFAHLGLSNSTLGRIPFKAKGFLWFGDHWSNQPTPPLSIRGAARPGAAAGRLTAGRCAAAPCGQGPPAATSAPRFRSAKREVLKSVRLLPTC